MNGRKGRKRIVPENWDLITQDFEGVNGDNDSDDDYVKPFMELRHNNRKKSESDDDSDDDNEGDRFLFTQI